MSHLKSKLLSKEPMDPQEARWKRLVKITYADPNGVKRTWESAERQTRPATSLVDGVGILTILNKPTGPEILLQKQYRPPLDRIVIEMPAGMVDAGETIEQSAIRELKEETGYLGVVGKSSFIMYNDPGFCNSNFNLVHMEVDLSLPENRHPEPQLEESEFIECFSIPVDRLHSELQRLEGEGYAIDARVAGVAEGVEMARKLKLYSRLV